MIQPTTPTTLAALLPLLLLVLGTASVEAVTERIAARKGQAGPPGMILAAASAGARTASGPTRPATGSAGAATVPYGLESRPSPEGRSLEEVLPREVGGFIRGPIDGFTDLPANADLNVDYHDERGAVTVGVTVAESPDLARRAVRAARSLCGTTPRRSPAPAVVESLDGDPSFVKAADFMAWSRGRHFFYVKASSPAALDHFMRHFPY